MIDKELKFDYLSVLIVGDVMLDRYWFGAVDRISPEAPVPVLVVKDRERRAGGAANVAHNVSVLGAKSKLLSVVGDDATGRELKQIVESFGSTAIFQIDKTIQTTEKLRMIAQNQQLLRADFEKKPEELALSECLQGYEKHIQQADVVILSDYGKGCLKHVQQMISLAKQAKVPVVVDPKGSDFSRYQGASLITPNVKEFTDVVGEIADDQDFEDKAFALADSLNIDALLVTRSERGMSLFMDGRHVHSEAKAREVYDVSGAGDTVISTVALALAAKMSLEDSLNFANAAAGVVVGKVGTATATISEITARMTES